MMIAGLWPDGPGRALDIADMDDIAWMLVCAGKVPAYNLWAEDREQSAIDRMDTYFGMA